MKITQGLIWIMAASAALLSAQDDPPGRVARLSYVYGSVSFQPAGENDWAPADFNRPLTTGDHVFVDFAGTGELQAGSAVLRLGSQTALEILNLDDSNAQLRLTEGTLVVRVRYLGDQDSFEVDTPNLAFSLLRPGEYRIDVKPDSATTIVTVRAGEGELTGPNQAFTVHPGEQTQVAGEDQPTYRTLGAPARDTLDNFCLQRDQRDDASPSARYVSRELVGYQDLDRYGAWRDTPDYGAVWVPNGTPDGWAPYHYGHWLWVDPWGWTWVDDAPWGFAPFHYGRWAYVGNYWAWVPGPVAQRPVYAPALVAWVGGGSIGGGVAWFALGPREVYVPTYHTSSVYVNRVNVTNTVIVNNINITNINTANINYRNRTAPGAVMAVQREAFAGARPVQSARIDVRADVIRSAPVISGAAIAPTRQSILRTPASGARVAQPPAAVQNRQVFVRNAPPPPAVPFAQRQAALQNNAGRPLDPNQVQVLRQNQPAPQRRFVRQVQAQPLRPAPQAAPAAPTPSVPPQAPPASQQSPGRGFDRRTEQPAQQRVAPPTPTPPVPPTPATPAPPSQATPRPFERRNDRPAQTPTQPPAQTRDAAPPQPVTPQQAPPATPQPAPQPAARPFERRNDRPAQTPTQPPAQTRDAAPPQPVTPQQAPPATPQPAPQPAARPFERRNDRPAQTPTQPPAQTRDAAPPQPAATPQPERAVPPPQRAAPPPQPAPAPEARRPAPSATPQTAPRRNDRRDGKGDDKDKKDKKDEK